MLLLRRFLIYFLVCVLGGTVLPAADATYSTTLDWTQDNDIETIYLRSNFSVWIPDGLAVVRGAVVEQGGVTTHAGAQAFARRHGFALIRISGTVALHGGTSTNFSRAYGGSGQALLDAMAVLATSSGRPEIAHLPLALFGFSAGGQFAYEFAMWKPARTLAFMLNKGGFYYTVNNTTRAGRNVPGWLVAGSADTQSRLDAIQEVAAMNRPLGARWAHAIEWGAGHAAGQADALFFPLLDRVIRQRYPAGVNPLAGPVTLLDPPPETLGWLGDPGTWKTGVSTVARHAEYAGNRDAAVWLYDADAAACWRAFTSSAADGTTPVALACSPAGPVVVAGASVTLTVTVNATAFPNVQSVTFYNGARVLGTVAAPGPYAFTWTPVPGGVHAVSAVAVNTSQVQRVSKPAWFVATGEIASMPPAPSHLKATAITDTRVQLGWTDNASTETGFKIERASTGLAFVQIGTAGANVTAYADTTAAAGQRYAYRVRAAGTVDSDWSNEAGTPWGVTEWRRTHFGSVADSGAGADTADPDSDGARNLVEYAQGTDPLASNAAPSAEFVAAGGQTYLGATVRRSLAAEGILLAGETSADLASWSPAVKTNEAEEGSLALDTFDDGAIGDRFSVNVAGGVSPYAFIATGGKGGSRAVDLAAGTVSDATLVASARSYDLSKIAYLEVRLLWKKKATAAGATALQIGLVGAPATRLSAYDDTGITEDAYASVRLGRSGTSLRLETQTKPGDSSAVTTANMGPAVGLTEGNWYELRVCFAREDTTTLRIWGSVLTAYDTGLVTNVLSGLGPVRVTLPHLAADAGVWVALRGFGDAGSDLWDELAVTARDENQTELWRDTVPMNGSTARRFLRFKATLQ